MRLAIALVLVSSCSKDPQCVDGRSLECACPGGARGAQVCKGGAYGPCTCEPSRARPKNELAKVQVDALVNAYRVWSVSHNDKTCPDTLTELDPDFTTRTVTDPWGRVLKFLCGDTAPAGVKGLAVYSMGEDGKDGTADDIKSWR